MRKKQANLYFPDKKYKDPPYLTKQQIKDFESQFTLFSRYLNVNKLKQAMINQNYLTSHRPVLNFVQKISSQKQQIGFSEYMNKMTQQLSRLNQGQLIAQILDVKGKNQIDKELIKQILQEALGRQILAQQMNEIMLKLFDTNSQKIPIQQLKMFVNQKYGK